MFISVTTARSLPTHQPISRENRHKYQIYAKFSLNSNFLYFLILANLTFYLAHHIVSDFLVHGFYFFVNISQEGSRWLVSFRNPPLFYIQQLPQAPYQDMLQSLWVTVLFPQKSKSFPRRTVLQISKLSKKGQKLSTIITTSKLQVVLKLSSQFNPSFFGLTMQHMDEAAKGKDGK